MRTAENFFRDIIEAWLGIKRWQMQSDSSCENDLMHSFKSALQMLTVLSLEDDERIIENRLELLILGLLHDVSEACIGGDISKPIKDDVRLCGDIDEIESQEFDKKFDELPLVAASYLEKINHIQGNMDSLEGRFFDGIENLGYITFALADIEMNRSAKNNSDFGEVLENRKPILLGRMNEFTSLRHISNLLFPTFERGAWNIENTTREIIKSWDKKAWPGYPAKETVLGRTMKTAILTSILIPLEMDKRKRKKAEEQIDGFKILSCALVHNLPKVKMGVLPYRVKTQLNMANVREIEKEKFVEIIDKFPEKTKNLMTEVFDLDHNEESLNGRFFAAIKFLSYALFALYEYEEGKTQFRDVLINCLPQLLKYNGEFKSFDMFFNLIKPRIESIVEGKSRIWVEVK